jgi:hypothetical protein
MSIKDYIISKIIRLKIVKDLCEKSKILNLIEKDSRNLLPNTIELLYANPDSLTKTELLYNKMKILKNLTSHIYRAERINFKITEDLLFKTIINYSSEREVFNFLCNMLKETHKDDFDLTVSSDDIRKEVYKRIRQICKLVLRKDLV